MVFATAVWLFVSSASHTDAQSSVAALTSRNAVDEMAKLKFLDGDWEYEASADTGVVRPDVVMASRKGKRRTITGRDGLSQLSTMSEHSVEGGRFSWEVTVWDEQVGAYESYIFRDSPVPSEIRTGRWMMGKLVFTYEPEIGFPMQSVTLLSGESRLITFYEYKSSPSRLLPAFRLDAERVSN